jgi:hypothetical protein
LSPQTSLAAQAPDADQPRITDNNDVLTPTQELLTKNS